MRDSASEAPFHSLVRASSIGRGSGLDLGAVVVGKQTEAALRFVTAYSPVHLLLLELRASGGCLDSNMVAGALANSLDLGEGDLVLFGAGQMEREAAARFAGRIGGFPCGEVLDIHPSSSGWRVDKLVYGGKLLASIVVSGFPVVANVRSNERIAVRDEAVKDIPMERRTLFCDGGELRVVDRRLLSEAGEERNLRTARVIVSGGRGIGGPEGFILLHELASRLGGAVGASALAVEKGWVPSSLQIGQTGLFVSPDLYIAVGISGASQHLFGVDERACIVAINTDPEAPIFEVADLGILGDYRRVLPALIEYLDSVGDSRVR